MLRFYLTGRVTIEGERLVDQSELPGRQGRLALVHLVAARDQPVPLTELAQALWGDDLPRTWEPSLRAVVSKLRMAIQGAGGGAEIASDASCYQVLLRDGWVDVEVAANAVDRAEGAWRTRNTGQAWSEAVVAAAIARRPLLPGEDLPWVAELRRRLRSLAVRSLDVLARVHLERAEHPLAVQVARELVELEPFREAGHRHLMRAHAAAGDRGEALRTYERLRALLGDELGVGPSTETEALYLAILRKTHDPIRDGNDSAPGR